LFRPAVGVHKTLPTIPVILSASAQFVVTYA
jgi:hypothetical protein